MNIDKWKRAGAAFVVALAAGLTVYYAIYGFPQPVKHQRYVSENTALRLMLRPSHIQHIVSDAVPGGMKYIPAMPRLNSTMGRPQRLDWLHYLPYEMTLLVDQSLTGDLASLLFVNDNPSGPDFAEIFSDSRVLAERFPFVWRPAVLARDDEEALVARGTFDIAESGWSAPSHGRVGGPFSLPKPEGKLLVDLAVDNGGAVLQAIHEGLRLYQGPILDDPALDQALLDFWPEVLTLHLRASLEDDETILILLDADLDGTSIDAATVDQVAESLHYFVSERAGLALEGMHDLSPVGLHAEYRIVGLASRLNRELGGHGI